MPGTPNPIDPTLLAYKVGEIRGDVETLFDRTKGVGGFDRRLTDLEQGQVADRKERREDRKEIANEISDLRRTIIQAMVSVFVATIGILVTLALVVK
jgi:hypothetical protein